MANLTQTTLTAAINTRQNLLNVASATGILAPTYNINQQIYVINPNSLKGELMLVTAVSGTAISVSRLDEFKQSFATGSIVLIGQLSQAQPMGFQARNPFGAPATFPADPLPWVNTVTGEQWLQGVGNIWVPGWNNPQLPGVTAAVASAAGLILPSGPLFHVTGALAVTGFTIPVGFAGGKFTIIPDGTFTWTTANNIGLAGTAVVSKALTFIYDSNAAKFYPDYIA